MRYQNSGVLVTRSTFGCCDSDQQSIQKLMFYIYSTFECCDNDNGAVDKVDNLERLRLDYSM